MKKNTDKKSIWLRNDDRHITSPTLQTLRIDGNEELLPERQSACQVCPIAIWFVEELKESNSLKVYCPKMNTLIYETENPVIIPYCDGMIQATMEAESEVDI